MVASCGIGKCAGFDGGVSCPDQESNELAGCCVCDFGFRFVSARLPANPLWRRGCRSDQCGAFWHPPRHRRAGYSRLERGRQVVVVSSRVLAVDLWDDWRASGIGSGARLISRSISEVPIASSE